MFSSLYVAFLIGATTIGASPFLVSRERVTKLSEDQVKAYKPYTLLARAAFCPPDQLRSWSCGTPCDDLSEMRSVIAQGDMMDMGWFVGYYPRLGTIVVSNEGTDPNDFTTSLTDSDFFLTQLDPTLFPGVPNEVQVHDGFQFQQARNAKAKLTKVRALIKEYNSSSITLTGLGRGGAVSLIDALYLSIHLPETKFKIVTHGMPRVGNMEFATYIDSHLPDVSRITNKHDPIPILPGTSLGYVHTSGEKHILQTDTWVACEGNDNPDLQCSTGDVPNVFEGDPNDNRGPYNGVFIDGSACGA